MNKFFLSVVTLGMMLASCTSQGLKFTLKSTVQSEENRPLKGFERIEQLGSIDVRYQQADSFSVIVKAPAEKLKDVETRVDGNRLVIGMMGANNVINFGMTDADHVVVYVTSPDFLGIELKGSGDFKAQGLVDTDHLNIILRGSGDVEFRDIICDQVNVSLVGSGDVDVKHVKTLRSQVELVGSGDIKMHFDDSGSVNASLTGSGDVTLKGTVQTFVSNVRGSGDMETSGLHISHSKTETTTTNKTNVTIK